MYEVNYAKDTFDLKLFILRLVMKIKYIVATILLIGLGIGITYYLINVTFDQTKEYSAKSTYYVEYIEDPYLENATIYYNDSTWNSLVDTDKFLEKIQIDDIQIGKGAMVQAITVNILSDVRVITIEVKTDDPIITEKLSEALVPVFMEFAQEQDVLMDVRLLDQTEVELVVDDVRTARAYMLGIAIGCIVAFALYCIYYFTCDIIVIPNTLRKRYALKTLGCDCEPELYENIKYACRDTKEVVVTPVSDTICIDDVLKQMKNQIENHTFRSVPSMEKESYLAEELRGSNGILLLVNAVVDTTTQIDRVLAFYEQQNINVLGFVLWNTNKKIYQIYQIGLESKKKKGR